MKGEGEGEGDESELVPLIVLTPVLSRAGDGGQSRLFIDSLSRGRVLFARLPDVDRDGCRLAEQEHADDVGLELGQQLGDALEVSDLGQQCVGGLARP